MTCVMFVLLLILWFALGAATMVFIAALGRAGRLQDERRAVAVRRRRMRSGSQSSSDRAA
jgi:hypothetical protein